MGCEQFDRPIDALLGHRLSGHSIKHVPSALGCPWQVLLVRHRQSLSSSVEVFE